MNPARTNQFRRCFILALLDLIASRQPIAISRIWGGRLVERFRSFAGIRPSVHNDRKREQPRMQAKCRRMDLLFAGDCNMFSAVCVAAAL